MGIDAEKVGAFIDAVGENARHAEEMLRREPGLRDGRWVCGETVLHFVTIEGTAARVRRLCEWGFDVNAVNQFGDAPLIDVAVLGREEVARVLLEFGADVNARSETEDCALHARCGRGMHGWWSCC